MKQDTFVYNNTPVSKLKTLKKLLNWFAKAKSDMPAGIYFMIDDLIKQIDIYLGVY